MPTSELEVKRDGDAEYIEIGEHKVPLDQVALRESECEGPCWKMSDGSCKCLDGVPRDPVSPGGNPLREILLRIAMEKGTKERIVLDLDASSEDLARQAGDIVKAIAAWRGALAARSTLVTDQVLEAKDLQTEVLEAGLDVTKEQ